MGSVLNQKHGQCFLRNFRDTQEKLHFSLQILELLKSQIQHLWNRLCRIFQWFSSSISSSSHHVSCSHRSFLLQLCHLDLLCSESVLYRLIMVLPSQVLCWWYPEWHQVFNYFEKSSPHSKVIWNSLSLGNVSHVWLYQTVALDFSCCGVLLEQNFMDSIQNIHQCNVVKSFVYIWLSLNVRW